jgi:hypothetical protein
MRELAALMARENENAFRYYSNVFRRIVFKSCKLVKRRILYKMNTLKYF